MTNHTKEWLRKMTSEGSPFAFCGKIPLEERIAELEQRVERLEDFNQI